jgi:para-aminobenzoate synthetase
MVRTLLIDNYDSYTYNLFQLIADVNGTPPVVMRNDAPEWSSVDLDAFDNVVVSPGPGHPGRERDFGHAAEVIAGFDRPLLGVCLGHQGIGLAVGAPVVPAPVARHGYVSRIRHVDDELFAGIAPNFLAVRYHSLCLCEPLPEQLVATAWAGDGVIMAIRRTDRPQWGVQFHPESVATEHGRRLLANFRDLSRPANGAAARSSVRSERTVHRTEVPSPRRFLLRSRRIDGAVDAAAVFADLYGDSPRAFWLDSSLVEPGRSRFSFLGDAGGPYAETLTYRVGDGEVVVERSDGRTTREPGTIFDVLARRTSAVQVDAGELPFTITGGHVGYFGYEVKADCGGDPAHRAETPDAVWIFADRIVAVDHEQGCTYAVALVEPGGSDEADAWLTQTTNTLLDKGFRPTGGDTGPREPVDVEPDLVRDRAHYGAEIEQCLRLLRAGESYEICLTNAVIRPRPPDPLAFYRRMRRDNPAPYGAFLRSDELVVAGSSPELFLRIDANGQVWSRPIKGTAARRDDPLEDVRAAETLRRSDKTRAENLMIVDLLRNDLGRVSEIGSVTVPNFMDVESYATMHQLVSTVRGRLRSDVSALDCVRACFPGGSMTGAPKLRTMEIIDALEGRARGVYSGALGYFGSDGSAELTIVIRTAVIGRDTMRVGAGGAIVLASDPEDEFEEMRLKATAPLGSMPRAPAEVAADGPAARTTGARIVAAWN